MLFTKRDQDFNLFYFIFLFYFKEMADAREKWPEHLTVPESKDVLRE